MGFLFGSKKNNAAATPNLTGMPVQTACYGKPLAIVYGATRAACNLIWYANFEAIAVNNPTSGGGGKGGVIGGGGKGGGSTTTNYYADLALAISEGPIGGINSVWQSQTQTSLAAIGLSLFDGAYAQGIWAGDTDPYSGVAYVAQQHMALGTSAQLPNFNFEVLGFYYGTAPGASYGGNGCAAGGDADPSLVVTDLLTNAHYGAGFPAGRVGEMATNNEAHTIPGSGPYTVTVANAASFQFNLDVVDGSGNIYQCVAASPGALQYSFNAATGVYTFAAANAGTAVTIRYASLNALATYQAWALASGLWISPCYDTATQASSLLDDIGTFTYASFVWSAGALKLVPRGTVAVAGNGYSYTPPQEPLFDLTDDDFLPNTNATGTASAASNDDPVILTRTRPSDQINDIKIEFLDRANQYAASIAECTDQANIDAFGRRPPSSLTGHLFCDANAANISAQLQMQDQYIRNTYSFTLDARYCMLDPMDIVTLTDAYLGLSRQWVRLTEITENDDGTLSVTAEEYPTGTGAAAEYALNIGSGYIPNYNQDPGPINAPILFAMPVQLASNGGLEIGCALSGTAPSVWGGCDVYASSDGASYRLVGRQTMPARMGVTTANFPAGSDPDTVDTLSVDLSQSAGQLGAGTQADADQDNTLCYVGGTGSANLLLAPDDLADYPTWFPSNATIDSDATAAPDGSLTAAQLNFSASSGTILQIFSVATFTDYTGAVWLRADAPVTVYVQIGNGGAGFVVVDTVAVTTVWQRFSVTTSSHTASILSFGISTFGPFGQPNLGAASVYAWMPIVVEGDTPGTIGAASEFVSYQQATLTGTNKYDLGAHGGASGYLRRGQYGTPIVDHPTGSPFARIDAGIFTIPYTVDQVGQTMYLKFPSFNIWDGGEESLSSVPAYQIALPAPPPPPNIQNFSATQQGGAVAFAWSAVDDAALRGVDVLYGPQGAGLGTAIFLTQAGAGTEMTNSSVPPGTWTFWAYAVDIAGQRSPIPATVNLVVTNESPVLIDQQFAPDWLGTLSGFVRHWTGCLIPDSADAANALTNAQLLEEYVPAPVASSSFTSGSYDTGFNDTLRVFFTPSAPLGPGQSGGVTAHSYLDTWLTGQSDPSTFTLWDSPADQDLRYVRGRLSLTSTAGSVALVTGFEMVVDQEQPAVESGTNVTIAAGGTTIAFANEYHEDPSVVVTVVAGVGLDGQPSSITKTGCVINVYNAADVSVGGIVNYVVTGV